MRILWGLYGVLLVAGFAAADVRADDAPSLDARGLARLCQPLLRLSSCRLYVLGVVDAQLALHAQGKLSAPMLCGYSIDESSLSALSKGLLEKGVDAGTSWHDPQFAKSPAAAFVYTFLSERFPCPAK
jgi:hypothetical protein